MALNADDEDFTWEPPSEAEMKVIQARRERQDKISKLIGDYLLKGYKMLGDCCEECGTILIQDRQKKNYCVACQELDSDVDKDNPALNAQAALSQVRERQLASNMVDGEPPSIPPATLPLSLASQDLQQLHVPRPEHCEGAVAGLKMTHPTRAPNSAIASVHPAPAVSGVASRELAASQAHCAASILQETEAVILQKIKWATRELQQTSSIETSIQLCTLLRSCTESLQGIKELLQ
ncbi:protein ZNRD2 [Latimeria chalumnae]|uniref:Zinc ribbon domain containing 2 n=1 Tax=Latimeria chalumnae TaxID=7897 RepID=H3AM71_LATCH|nr:PREDICTED: Sjoegren syndrome/scleroderma autoantigen 1 [Latimeria chalumnae]|eukprot:XP_005998149.1 PREDICTED: Sjoegren syndrome/scleroderma autoantigen 1 [Latimeria chalumnae]